MRLIPIAILLVTTGCMTAPEDASVETEAPVEAIVVVPADRSALFREAVVASAVPAKDAASPLVPLSGKSATMVSWAGPYYKLGKNTLDFGALWVTPAPQVQQACQAFSGNKRAALEEYLGLQPGGGKGRSFVTMTVDTGAMFRPCPDTRVDQTSCPMALPDGPPKGVSDAQWNADLRFLLNQMLTSYVQDGGYPFTRLGYTYNWAKGGNRVGASEYVVRKGTTVNVTAITSVDDYCAAPGS